MTTSIARNDAPRVISDHDWAYRLANAVQALCERIGGLLRRLLGAA